MKTSLLAVLLALSVAISGCTMSGKKTVIIDQTRPVLVTIPDALLKCPQIGKPPNPETLTNQQVADYIEKLYRYHRTCGINMTAIKNHIEKLKKEYNYGG